MANVVVVFVYATAVSDSDFFRQLEWSILWAIVYPFRTFKFRQQSIIMCEAFLGGSLRLALWVTSAAQVSLGNVRLCFSKLAPSTWSAVPNVERRFLCGTFPSCHQEEVTCLTLFNPEVNTSHEMSIKVNSIGTRRALTVPQLLSPFRIYVSLELKSWFILHFDRRYQESL